MDTFDRRVARMPGAAGPLGVRLFLCFTFFYFFAHLPLLLVQGPLWDDWGWRDLNSASVQADLGEIARPLAGWVFQAYDAVSPRLNPIVAVAPLVAFVGHYLAWLILLRANREGGFLDPAQAFWASLLSAVAPLNFSRAVAATGLYQIAFLVFSLAVLCFIAGLVRRQSLLRVASWPLFALACQVESFYFATMLLFVPAWWLRRAEGRNPAALLRLAYRHGELLVIPVACYVARALFFAPDGSMVNYNRVTLPSLAKAVPSSLISAAYTVYASLSAAAVQLSTSGLSHRFPLAAALLLLVVAVSWLFRLPGLSTDATRRDVAVAFLAFAFLILPYSATRNVIVRPLSNWDDRDMLTATLGNGLLLVTIVAATVRSGMRRAVLTAMAGMMVVGTVMGYLALARDDLVMAGLMVKLRGDEAARNGHNFVYVAGDVPLWQGRTMRPYEWNNMMALAYGDETRVVVPLALDEPAVSTLAKLGALSSHGTLGFRDWHPGGPILKIQVEEEETVSVGRLLRLAALRALGDPRYPKEAASLVRLIVTPFADGKG